MPGQLTEFELEDGTSVLIETSRETGDRGDRPLARGLGAEKANGTFEAAIARIRPVAEAVLKTLRDMNTPKEVEVEFGVGLTAQAGAFFASAESEVNFKVRLLWENTKDGRG